MIVLFWNMRGLGKLAKHCTAILEAKADIACLCETKLATPTNHLTSALGARRIDWWVSKDSIGASGHYDWV